MRYLKFIIVAMMFVFANSAMAGTAVLETATIKSVDVENNTITVELDKSGMTKTYSFPEMVTFIDNGVSLVDKSAFKPGQSVKLKFESEKPRLANPMVRAKPEYTLKGMTVK